MNWLARLKNEIGPDNLPAKPTNPGYVGFVGTPQGHIQIFKGQAAPANDPTPEPEAQSKPTMSIAQADTYAARLALFTDRGMGLVESELLANRLLTRDLERDHRAVCLECLYLHRRHCGNYRRAGVAVRAQDARLPADFVVLLQRCNGFVEQLGEKNGKQ